MQQELFQKIMDKKKGRQWADQLVKVHLKDGEEKWVLIHVEVQSDNEKDFAERMFQYFYRIYDRYHKEIVAIAVMTSPHQSTFPTQFHYSYFGTELHYAYTNCKLSDYDNEELEKSDKLFSKVVLAAKYMNDTREDADKRYTFKMKLMREILQSDRYSHTEILAVFYFIDYLLRLPKELTEQFYDTMVPIIEKEVKQMVQFNNEDLSPTMEAVFTRIREEGERKGIEKGIEKVVLEMLKEGLPDDLITKVTNMNKEAIEKLRSKNR
ncbi:Rpn family recombination-promoting nuclease/putative transposase [Sporosarcina soli]|uniref:Rpn family recombination-promoting nuclease/putative transposase n=1 Tax=Sporosarcina soli TaxID=334736 RepID=A0ABW0TQG3_9BACL